MLAVAFGFMLHVRKRERQKYSEACRPLLGKYTDGVAGRLVDLLAVFALIAGTATTFSVATPLMASIIDSLFGVELDRTVVTIIILLITCFIYTYSLLHGFKGISILAKICIFLFFGLLAYVFVFVVKPNIFLKPVYHHWDECSRTSLSWLHTQTHVAQLPFLKIGLFIIGHTGWYGVLRHLFHREHIKGQNNSSNHSWRLCFWCWFDNCQFHCAW